MEDGDPLEWKCRFHCPLGRGMAETNLKPWQAVFLIGQLPTLAPPLKAIATNFASLNIGLLCLLPMLCYEAPQRAQVEIYLSFPG